jgi:hypothetical protein
MPVAESSSPVFDDLGITTVVVYGKVDFTIDCIMAQLPKINGKTNEINKTVLFI